MCGTVARFNFQFICTLITTYDSNQTKKSKFSDNSKLFLRESSVLHNFTMHKNCNNKSVSTLISHIHNKNRLAENNSLQWAQQIRTNTQITTTQCCQVTLMTRNGASINLKEMQTLTDPVTRTFQFT